MNALGTILRLLAMSLAFCTAAGGCSILDPTFAAPATIIFAGDTGQITVPATAVRGVAFAVSVTTFGGGCTRKIARTEQRLVDAEILANFGFSSRLKSR